MKTRLLVVITALLAAIGAKADSDDLQLNVDYNQINVEVMRDPDGYRALMNRYLDADTTLTLDEMARVYYGFAFTYDYDPTYDYTPITDSFRSADKSEAFGKINRQLKYDPLSLELLALGVLAAEEIGTDEALKLADNYQGRFNLVASTIFASGTGNIPESPYKVICESDRNSLLINVLGITEIAGVAEVEGLEAFRVKFADKNREYVVFFDNWLKHNFMKQLPAQPQE